MKPRNPPVSAVPPPMDEATADALLDAVDDLERHVRATPCGRLVTTHWMDLLTVTRSGAFMNPKKPERRRTSA